MYQKFSEIEKTIFVSFYHSGSTAKEVCELFGISKSTFYQWIKEYSINPQTNRTNREFYLMQKESKRLRHENQIYKLSCCVPSSPLQEKLAAIERLKGEYSIHALCRTFNVLRSTYYYYFNAPKQNKQIALQDEAFKPIITEIFEISKSRFGAKRIRAKMVNQGYIISDRRIARLMKEMGLTVAKRQYPNATFEREYKYYPNKLKRDFSQPEPNLVWVSDITYVRVSEGIYYLCVVIDLFSRKVVAYSISQFINTDLVAESFQKAFIARGYPTNLLFHSDQGSQYASYSFRSLLRQHRVTQSFSKPGSPHDNAVAESFFASLKKEEFKLNYYTTLQALEQSVSEYIKFYNEYRPHQRLGYKTPDEFELATKEC